MAHIRSILPQRGGVSPVDNNTTALFHYDEHTGDSLKGMKSKGELRAAQFAAASNNMVDINTSSPITTTSSFTISTWIYPSTITALSVAVYVGNDGGGYGFGIGNGAGGSGSKLQGLFGGVTWVDSGYTFSSANTWYHIVMKREAGITKFFVNGIQTATTNPNTPGAIANKVTIAGMYSSGNASKMRFFDGRISDTIIWDTSLSDSDILAIYNGVDSTISPVGRWKLNEGQNTIIGDLSKAGNDGLASGLTWVEGRAVYSLVSGGYPGSNGKGVLIEESTTNLFTSPYLTNNSNTTVGTSTLLQETFLVNGDTLQGVTLNQGISADIISINMPVTTVPTGQVTFSAWMKSTMTSAIKAQIQCTVGGVQYWLDNSNVWATGSAVEKTNVFATYTNLNEWQKVTFTLPAFPSGALTAFSFSGWYRNAGNMTCSIANIQLEQKLYATSFVVGTRPMPHLAYPKSIINPGEGTMSFWMNPLNKNPNSYPSIMGLGAWSSGSTVDWLSVYWGSGWNNANTIYAGLANSVDTQQINISAPGAVIEANKWMFVVVRWDFGAAKEFNFTVWDTTGVKRESINTIAFTAPTFANQTGFYVGCSKDWNSTSAPNAEFDELRIDKVYRSDTEIASWYYQGRNGW